MIMINLQRAKKCPTIFRRLTGISPQAFEELMAVLNKAYPDFERRRLSRRREGTRYLEGKVVGKVGEHGGDDKDGDGVGDVK
ncbi:MAG: hypothetical protein ACK4Z6_05565, partial [Candidatus Methylomirabilales bacterium]